MASNIELKARLRDPAFAIQVAGEIATSGPELLVQRDTYFTCNNGRLKLRQHESGPTQLIWYDRQDGAASKRSHYEIVDVQDAGSMISALSKAWGVEAVVSKRRQLWWVDHVRIHIDEVESLGHFLEFEAVLDAAIVGDPTKLAAEVQRVDGLASKLGIVPNDRIAGSYRELILSCPAK